MDVTLVICTRNRAADLAPTLRSIQATRVPNGLDVELLVVDNGSTDATPDVIAEASSGPIPVRHVVEPTPGLSHARNCALREARGDVFLFTDDDVRVPTGWIEGMTRPIRQGTADAVAGGVQLASHLPADGLTSRARSLLAETVLLDPDVPTHFVGANMALSRRVFERIWGFDDELGAGPNSFGFAEETLLAYQIGTAGFRIVGALDVCVNHHCHADRLARDAFLQTMAKQGRSKAYLDYHWHHEPPEPGSLLAALAKAYARLLRMRYRKSSDVQQPLGMTVWEMEAVERIHRLREYLRQRGTPRNYERHGLRKRNRPPSVLTESSAAVLTDLSV